VEAGLKRQVQAKPRKASLQFETAVAMLDWIDDLPKARSGPPMAPGVGGFNIDPPRPADLLATYHDLQAMVF